MFLVLFWNPSLKSSYWRTYHSLLRSTLHLIRIHIVEINLDKHTLKAHFLELTVLLLSEVSSSSCEFSSSSSFSSMLCPLQSSEDPWLPWVGWLDFNRKWACPHCQARERFSTNLKITEAAGEINQLHVSKALPLFNICHTWALLEIFISSSLSPTIVAILVHDTMACSQLLGRNLKLWCLSNLAWASSLDQPNRTQLHHWEKTKDHNSALLLNWMTTKVK